MSDPFAAREPPITLNGVAPSFPKPRFQRGVSLIKEGRTHIGPALAKIILTDMNYARQRRTTPGHIGKLAYEMSAGLFLPGSQIYFVRLPDGSLHMINGQHRLHGVIQSGVEIEFQIFILQVGSPQEMHAAYRKIDGVQQTRSAYQVLNSAGTAEDNQIQKRTTVAVYAAAPIIELKLNVPYAFLGKLGTPDGRREAAEPWWPSARVYDKAIEKAPAAVKRRLLNASVTAVGLVTLDAQPVKALDFWSGIAAAEGLKKGDPRNTLIWSLLGKNNKGDAGAILAMACVAWNHFFLGSEVSYLRPVKVNYLLGTPLARGYRRISNRRAAAGQDEENGAEKEAEIAAFEVGERVGREDPIWQ